MTSSSLLSRRNLYLLLACVACLVLLVSLLLVLVYVRSGPPMPTAEALLQMMAAMEDRTQTVQGQCVTILKSPTGMETFHATFMSARNIEQGKTICRHAIQMRSSSTEPGETGTHEIRLVNDGRFLWCETRSSEVPGIRVRKSWSGDFESTASGYSPMLSYGRWEEWLIRFDFSKVGEDSIDGRRMYVLDATLCPGKLPPGTIDTNPPRMKLYVDQELLYVRRGLKFDKTGKEYCRYDWTNVRFDDPISPETFQYTPPPGAKLTDNTADAPAPEPPVPSP